MTIAERLTALAPTALCKAGQIIAGLAPEDRAAVEAAMATHSATTIAKVLTAEGRPVGKSTMILHKAGDCACRQSQTA